MRPKLKTVVLRRSGAATNGAGQGIAGPDPVALAAGHPEMWIESLEAEDGERTEIATEADTACVALSIPFTRARTRMVTTFDTGTCGWGITAIRADEAGPEAGRGVKTAILDTGIAAEHPAFDGLQPVSENFTDDVPEDIDGNGTHCASILFGQDIGHFRIGIARGVSKPLIGKVLARDGGDSASIFSGLLWACRNGARVIAVSPRMDLGLFLRRLVEQGYHAEDANAVALQGYTDNLRLFGQVRTAAGTSPGTEAPLLIAGADIAAQHPDCAMSAASGAGRGSILTVGAIDVASCIAPFSGPRPECVAPGIDIPGAAHTGGIFHLSGNGIAASHVAGLAILIAARLAVIGAYSADDLRTEILDRAWSQAELPRTDQGRGLVQL